MIHSWISKSSRRSTLRHGASSRVRHGEVRHDHVINQFSAESDIGPYFGFAFISLSRPFFSLLAFLHHEALKDNLMACSFQSQVVVVISHYIERKAHRRAYTCRVYHSELVSDKLGASTRHCLELPRVRDSVVNGGSGLTRS